MTGLSIQILTFPVPAVPQEPSVPETETDRMGKDHVISCLSSYDPFYIVSDPLILGPAPSAVTAAYIRSRKYQPFICLKRRFCIHGIFFLASA